MPLMSNSMKTSLERLLKDERTNRSDGMAMVIVFRVGMALYAGVLG